MYYSQIFQTSAHPISHWAHVPTPPDAPNDIPQTPPETPPIEEPEQDIELPPRETPDPLKSQPSVSFAGRPKTRPAVATAHAAGPPRR
jgi:hypothetical protein